ncbi:MAG: hypothetical protein ACRCV6_03005 [Formosimonas sp.]
MSNSNFIQKAAYCAIFIGLSGCTSLNSNISNAAIDDVLTASRVQARAQAIPNLATAQNIERDALARQAAADASVVGIEARCAPKFLVNRCIEQARDARNEAWDSAQVDLTAARLHIRTFEANQKRAELQKKLTDYAAEEKANIPVRAANKAAFIAKQAALQTRQAEYAAAQIAQAPERAAKASAFEAKRVKILELQQKRAADNAKRVAQAAAAKK